jgi:hypothetical protein
VVQPVLSAEALLLLSALATHGGHALRVALCHLCVLPGDGLGRPGAAACRHAAAAAAAASTTTACPLCLLARVRFYLGLRLLLFGFGSCEPPVKLQQVLLRAFL